MTRISLLGIATLVAALLCTSCAHMSQAKLAEVEAPGWFDVGAGYGVVRNVRSGPDNDADGLLVSFKGYPLGRWYSRRKPASTVALEGVSDAVTRGNDSLARAEAEVTRLEAEVVAKKNAYDSASGDAQASAKQALADSEDQLLKAKGDRDNYRLLDAQTVQTAVDQLEALRKQENVVVEERNKFWYRFSVFYGLSPDSFSGGGLEGGVNAVGIGFDITPELALLFGSAFYEFEENGVSDTDDSIFMGISLNLNAFNFFRSYKP